MLRRVITFWIVLFIVFYVVTEPAGAAGFAHDWYNGVHGVAKSLATFVNQF